jgi:hypothetical protein
MKMRQSLAEIEEEFRYETELDRSRRDNLRRHAVSRARNRRRYRRRKQSSMRFWMLVCTLIVTALLVTAAMFETLYRLLG